MNYVLNQYKISKEFKEFDENFGIPFTEIKELEELLKLEKLTCNVS